MYIHAEYESIETVKAKVVSAEVPQGFGTVLKSEMMQVDVSMLHVVKKQNVMTDEYNDFLRSINEYRAVMNGVRRSDNPVGFYNAISESKQNLLKRIHFPLVKELRQMNAYAEKCLGEAGELLKRLTGSLSIPGKSDETSLEHSSAMAVEFQLRIVTMEYLMVSDSPIGRYDSSVGSKDQWGEHLIMQGYRKQLDIMEELYGQDESLSQYIHRLRAIAQRLIGVESAEPKENEVVV